MTPTQSSHQAPVVHRPAIDSNGPQARRAEGRVLRIRPWMWPLIGIALAMAIATVGAFTENAIDVVGVGGEAEEVMQPWYQAGAAVFLGACFIGVGQAVRRRVER